MQVAVSILAPIVLHAGPCVVSFTCSTASLSNPFWAGEDDPIADKITLLLTGHEMRIIRVIRGGTRKACVTRPTDKGELIMLSFRPRGPRTSKLFAIRSQKRFSNAVLLGLLGSAAHHGRLNSLDLLLRRGRLLPKRLLALPWC